VASLTRVVIKQCLNRVLTLLRIYQRFARSVTVLRADGLSAAGMTRQISTPTSYHRCAGETPCLKLKAFIRAAVVARCAPRRSAPSARF